MDVDRYLERIGFEGRIAQDLDTLTRLQLAHLQAVPFENLNVFADRGVRTDDDWTYAKVVDEARGGWCFEVNGAFAQLLEALGFVVSRLGAAVLLGGPNVIVDHLVLEVALDEPYLVEVGFGDDAPIVPLPLNRLGHIDGGSGTFAFLASPQGTTLTQIVDGVPEARYRFKRVAHAMADFDPASHRLQTDRTLHWSRSPFATRLIDDAGTRIILTRDTLKTRRGAAQDQVAVPAHEWSAVLLEQFGITESISAEQLRRPDG